jgi:type IV pilus assembly protein PilB
MPNTTTPTTTLTPDEQLLEMLRTGGIITPEIAARVGDEAKKGDVNAEEIIRRDRLASEEDVAKAKGKILNIDFFDLTGKTIPVDVISIIPEQTAESFNVIPIAKEGDLLEVGMVNPSDYRAIESVEFCARGSGLGVVYKIISPKAWRTAMRAYELAGKEVAHAVQIATEKFKPAEEEKPTAGVNLEQVVKGAPVSRIVSVILKSAVDQNASDIHIEPYGNITRVRFRIDGMLKTALTLPLFLHPAIVSRVKVLAGLKLDETRIPQDGRIRQVVSGRTLDFRISTMPVVDYEKVVMRILSAGDESTPTLETLGFRKECIDVWKEQIKHPHGLFLVTGPTGCGKSTTLYTVLSMRNEEGLNIVTLEDPIEYYIKGTNQSQIRPEINYSFATGLRAILRQDPNIIMVGEIRDRETAELAVHAALTGHLIFSTLHTNDAFGVVPRLIDIGVEPFLLAATLNVAIAQRLARKVCEHCRVAAETSAEGREYLSAELNRIPKKYLEGRDLTNLTTYHAPGCQRCNGTGYIGRTSVSEYLLVTDNMRKIIENGFPIDEARNEAAAQEMLTLKQDGVLKILDGVTTLEEVMRITKE